MGRPPRPGSSDRGEAGDVELLSGERRAGRCRPSPARGPGSRSRIAAAGRPLGGPVGSTAPPAPGRRNASRLSKMQKPTLRERAATPPVRSRAARSERSRARASGRARGGSACSRSGARLRPGRRRGHTARRRRRRQRCRCERVAVVDRVAVAVAVRRDRRSAPISSGPSPRLPISFVSRSRVACSPSTPRSIVADRSVTRSGSGPAGPAGPVARRDDARRRRGDDRDRGRASGSLLRLPRLHRRGPCPRPRTAIRLKPDRWRRPTSF